MPNFEIGTTTTTVFCSPADIAALEGGGWFVSTPKNTPREGVTIPLECVSTVAPQGAGMVALSTHYVLPTGALARGYWKRDSAPSICHNDGCVYCGDTNAAAHPYCPSCGAS